MMSDEEAKNNKTGLSKDFIFLILQYLNEEKYKETLHKLERESGCFFNLNYFEELVLAGYWEEAEKYLSAFTKLEDNQHSRKIIFEIRKQKYFEALDKHDRATATDILVKELKAFAVFNENLFKDLTHLLTLNNFREHEQLTNYINSKTARMMLITELKKLLVANPIFRDKLIFPNMPDSRLKNLLSQSFNWQHMLCKHSLPNHGTETLFMDHDCYQHKYSYERPSSSNRQNVSGSRVKDFNSLDPNKPFQPIAVPVQSPFTSWLHNIPSVTQPELLEANMDVPTNPVALMNYLRTPDVISNSRPSGISDRMKLPSTSPGGSDSLVLNLTDELPMTVVRTLNQGSCARSMDFHPFIQTLLLVGTNIGDIALWDVGSREKVVSRNFILWDVSTLSSSLKSAVVQDPCVAVNCVKWSPDGSLFGVAYSRHLMHLYSYLGENHIQRHLEIDSHIGAVNDLAFSSSSKQLSVITCGDDRTIKVWDVATGAKLFTFEGHEAPVHSVCPHMRENIHFILSTSMDGKIKAWLYDMSGAMVNYDAPGGWCTTMAYSNDGKRLFSCGTNQTGETRIVEWIESEGLVKRSYQGFHKHCLGIVQFDTAKNRFLVAGHDHLIKFWEMGNVDILTTFDAGGDLPPTPSIRYNKEGTLLAVSTNDNRVKILATLDGILSLRAYETCAITASRIASKAITENADTRNLEDKKPRLSEDDKTMKTWMPTEFNRPSQFSSLVLPATVKVNKIMRLIYTNSGNGILALASNAIHLLWKWPGHNKATTKCPPRLWQPPSEILMTNDLTDARPEEAMSCFALSKNDSYLVSSSGGKISLFNMLTFKTMMAFMRPPPMPTCLAFHPQDNNIIAVGMDDCTVQIYNVRVTKVTTKLKGHSERITGLAFSSALNSLVSSGADAQSDVWIRQKSSFLEIPAGRSAAALSDTQVHFHQDQIHFLAVHETQLSMYETTKMERIKKWLVAEFLAPISHATFSCDSHLVYACFLDGTVGIFCSSNLQLQCQINPIAYLPSSFSSSVIAAHPQKPNQFAVGLTDGRVHVFEPLESEGQWGTFLPVLDNGSPSNIPTPPPTVASSSCDQPEGSTKQNNQLG